ncbi:ligase-associated DNA damage response DEXH box helicase [Agriterribacter sp.]|uniref:ligase-associated DNA damage response DEXH box helicase n=1 Tax=Agriterribacter sp. TaxID=2821509 RepID=UPI002CDCA1C9|nr:ligase-associated DNA damage response DEXH box helicase [Agriterribacter sp.]HTN05271.1 ligase-associated DNA damage response DEXH box helicase [Agriterribacter sp.]
MQLHQSAGYKAIQEWLAKKEFKPFAFQEETWQYIINGKSGLVNAPTGFGKTFSVFLGAVIDFINQHPADYKSKAGNKLQLVWVTPLRALAKDIGRAMEEVITELGMRWRIGIRNGDTPTAERLQQKKHPPEVLIITPESLHLLLAQKNYPDFFATLKIIAVDEWHELLGSKRGVQVELAISRLVSLPAANTNYSPLTTDYSPSTAHRSPFPLIWGISATIGNLTEAGAVLHASLSAQVQPVIVRAQLKKNIKVESIFPDEIEKYPWAGHLGIKLMHKVLPIIDQSRTTLIFINTRGMSETWYQGLLNAAPELAGAIALHHGSIEPKLRTWVEEALHAGILKAVVCTASLDLGVDFRPVETVIQVGSPKGVARFLQRAGRSGHQPDAVSKIYFLPTHSLELVEASALKSAIAEDIIESREPMLLCFDVLIQYLCTLAVADGFAPDIIYKEVLATHCYKDMTRDEWLQILQFITAGGAALQQYDEFKKVEIINGLYRITNRRIAMRHRMHIGTIVSEAMLKVKFMSGGYIGVIEEWFISRLDPGAVFTLAGRNLELAGIKDMTVLVKKSNSKKSIIPSWQGGRMPLSANLGKKLREELNKAGRKKTNLSAVADHKKQIAKRNNREIDVLKPLFDLQEQLSHVPKHNELLIEHIETKDGYHLFVFPFEGRLVHEAMAAILAWRISRLTPVTFSFAMNDYGFELLSDQPIPVDDSNVYELFSPDNLLNDIQRSVNATEMAMRKFRDIAVIGGLIFQGFPGEEKKARHLQSSASLLFKVFNEYDSGNVLMQQAYREVLDQQMEEVRLRHMLERIQQSRIIITFPAHLTPFCFPIKVDSLRESLTSEKLEDRVRKMQQQLY